MNIATIYHMKLTKCIPKYNITKVEWQHENDCEQLNAQFFPSAYYFVVHHLEMIMIKIIIIITTL